MNSSTRGRVTLAACSLFIALALSTVADLHAQSALLSKLGTFYSAKDPDLPPLPFNPHPELSLVEVEKGVYVVDDTGIPDTPEQAAARILRQEAAARAAAIAADPVLAQAAQAAQQAAQQASFAATIEEVSPWLHEPIKLPNGTPTDFQTLIAQSVQDLAAATGTNDWSKAALERALAWASTNDLPTEIPAAGDLGSKAYLVSIDDGPLYLTSCNVEAAQTISTDKVWPGGSAGLNLNGTNGTLFMGRGPASAHAPRIHEPRLCAHAEHKPEPTFNSSSWHLGRQRREQRRQRHVVCGEVKRRQLHQ